LREVVDVVVRDERRVRRISARSSLAIATRDDGDGDDDDGANASAPMSVDRRRQRPQSAAVALLVVLIELADIEVYGTTRRSFVSVGCIVFGAIERRLLRSTENV
jgi:hypothetical protein